MLKKLNQNKKFIISGILLLCTVTFVCLDLGTRNYVQQVEWVNYDQNYKKDAFLYSFETSVGELFIASDKELHQDSLSEKNGKLSLLSNSGFFDPSVCAKMPAVIKHDYFFFRGYTYGSKDKNSDIIYRFNLVTKELMALVMAENMVGDIYTDVGGSLFYFTLEEGKIVKNLFFSNFTRVEKIVVNGIDSVDEKRIDFFVGMPYMRILNMEKGGKYDYYKYSIETNKFYLQKSIERVRGVSSSGSMLIVPIQSTVYTAYYRKKLHDSLTEVRDKQEKIIFSYNGDANLYFISFR